LLVFFIELLSPSLSLSLSLSRPINLTNNFEIMFIDDLKQGGLNCLSEMKL
jgi:hypothetical protein